MAFDPEERQMVGRLLSEVRSRAPLSRERERELARNVSAGLDGQGSSKAFA